MRRIPAFEALNQQRSIQQNGSARKQMHKLTPIPMKPKLFQKSAKICQESAKNQLVNDRIYAPSAHTPAQSCQRGPGPPEPNTGGAAVTSLWPPSINKQANKRAPTNHQQNKTKQNEQANTETKQTTNKHTPTHTTT